MSGSRRVTVRLNKQRVDRLQQYCEEASIDLSRALRQALDTFLAPDSATNGTARRPLAPPAEIIPLTSRYLGWGDGDLRKEIRRLYRETLAAAIAGKRLYSRTEWVIQAYEALLALYPVVEPEE